MNQNILLRRIALNQQGLLKADSFGRGKNATLRAIEQIGYVQIDTISVVERAHHHVLWSRVENYQPTFLDELVAQKKVFEYWSHAAAWLPMRDYRFALPRMQEVKLKGKHWGQEKNKKLMQSVIDRIENEGPLMARDFEDTRSGKKLWWDFKPAKQALEQLFMQGDLMVLNRKKFQKVYDLPERVLPDDINTQPPTFDEYANYLIDSSLRAHGFTTQKSMAYLRKGKPLREAISEQINIRISDQTLIEVRVGDQNIAYINPALLDSPKPRNSAAVRILSPFDNLLIQRQRGLDIFNFNYKIECYVPAAKRQYGYFCLPILYKDQLVGRIDCKAHRKEKRLEVISKYIEQPVDAQFEDAFKEAIKLFARFNQCY